jgi:hypothetical protein
MAGQGRIVGKIEKYTLASANVMATWQGYFLVPRIHNSPVLWVAMQTFLASTSLTEIRGTAAVIAQTQSAVGT